jgi:oligopeptide transport system permease protein
MSAAATKSAARGLGGDAWKRLRRNRPAVIALVFVMLLAGVGFASPLIGEHIIGFSPAEIHSRLAGSPGGVQDVSIDHPAWDGDPTTFAFLDADGDGFIACTLLPAVIDEPPGLRELANWSPTLHAEAAAAFEKLDAEINARKLMGLVHGQLDCPELRLAQGIASRHFDFLFDRWDRPADPTSAPDGALTPGEFPKDDEALAPSLRGLGLSGPEAFRALDVDGNGRVTQAEVTARTRYLRVASRPEQGGPVGFDRWLTAHDTNGDLRISAAEYPGAPVLRTFHLGTDHQGRDLLTRLLHGARLSILIGLLSTLVSLIIGVTWGAIAGYVGGRVDNVMMRIVDVLYGLPFMFLVILIMVMLDDRNDVVLLFIVLGAVQWLTMARVVRGQVMALRQREFVEAARAIGAPPRIIIFRHLVRNAVGPVVVYATLLVPAVILEEAFLSFLGLGVDLSWGNMIAEGSKNMLLHPWLIVWPGLALAATLFAMNILGDGVRDAIDPQMQGR